MHVSHVIIDETAYEMKYIGTMSCLVLFVLFLNLLSLETGSYMPWSLTT